MIPCRSLFVALLIGWASMCTAARADHGSDFYPSFYPQEIRIEVVDPGSAAALLEKNSLHAYLGSDPFPYGTLPANVGAVEFLGSYMVVTFNPVSELAEKRESRCATARRIRHLLSRERGAFVFHPHPVTPYHEDYLHHFDLVESLKKDSLSAQPAGENAFKLRARGQVAEMLARARWQMEESEWQATIEQVDLDTLMASRTASLNGWLGPSWLKEGWFHAYLLLSQTMSDQADKQRADSLYQRLVKGAYDGVVERVNLERALVSLLTRGCERVVLGYTVKRAYFNSDFSGGVENIAHDSHAGFISPVFIRTVKLKDFPWNGWLTLGTDARPSAAWNPIAGFTDPTGRLIWFSVGDPALLPAPSDGSWIPNRVTPVAAPKGSVAAGIDVPPDALIPEPGTGLLKKVGPGKRVTSKITYRVRASAFHDGTRMSVDDVLYAFSFAYRWGARPSRDGKAVDPVVEASTALMRERLAGLRLVRVEHETKQIADIKLVWQVPVIEVYLHSASSDPQHEASVAPPWTGVPWHVLALMEEAVRRGAGAFSLMEATRRGVGWLDVVRDQSVRARLLSLTEEFERRGYLPDALKGFATVEDARQRWAALKRFSHTQGHFLVTNGPYRLDKWAGDAVVLQVFRDSSYPLGFGSFDRYALPPKASIVGVERRPTGLEISGEMEKAVRVQRNYTNVREPLTKASTVRGFPADAVCRYLAVDPDGNVVRAGAAPIADAGTFAVDLRGLPPGRYTVMSAIYLNGNAVNPEVKTVDYAVSGSS